jgi:hypothetical protein
MYSKAATATAPVNSPAASMIRAAKQGGKEFTGVKDLTLYK